MIIFQDVDESADISPSSSVLSLRQEEVIFLHTFFHISPLQLQKNGFSAVQPPIQRIEGKSGNFIFKQGN